MVNIKKVSTVKAHKLEHLVMFFFAHFTFLNVSMKNIIKLTALNIDTAVVLQCYWVGIVTSSPCFNEIAAKSTVYSLNDYDMFFPENYYLAMNNRPDLHIVLAYKISPLPYLYLIYNTKTAFLSMQMLQMDQSWPAKRKWRLWANRYHYSNWSAQLHHSMPS